MRTITVNLDRRSYDIHIGAGTLSCAAERISGRGRVFLVSDSNVADLYLEKLNLTPHGICIIEPGEKSKSMDCLMLLYKEMLKSEITRSDLVVALGGGVVGDLAGYAAATFQRGVPFVQVPTTLLAQVDSSVGGKVAVNLEEGKNLVGAFYQPLSVLADTSCLSTLSDRVFADGMAEVIKYGAIMSEGLFEKLESLNSRARVMSEIDDIVFQCCNIKRTIVEDDEFDTGRRAILNFGHTAGHAIEKYYNYERYTHGEAVAVGMVFAAQKGEELGVTASGTANRIKRLLEKFSLPTQTNIPTQQLAQLWRTDKKSTGELLNFILLRKIGDSVIHPIAKPSHYS